MTAAANTLPPITFGEGCDTDTLAYILSKIQGLVFDAHVRDGKGTLVFTVVPTGVVIPGAGGKPALLEVRLMDPESGGPGDQYFTLNLHNIESLEVQ